MEFSRRKWGYYLTIWSAKYFKIKLLWFREGAACSMQKHFKRAETWLCLYGSGLMHVDGQEEAMRHGEFSQVRVGAWHQYTADKNTLIIEIQTGECREDDIERA